MKATTRAAWARPLSAFGGLLLALASIWLLGILNARATIQMAPQQHARHVLIRGPESRETVDERSPEKPKPELPEPEVMEVDLDLPMPEARPLEPLRLETPLPMPSPVRVAVSQAPAAPAPRPQPPAQPPAVQSAAEVDQPPRESPSNPAPVYPPAKLRSRVEGTVVLRLLIDQSGRVEEVKVVSGDPEFVQSVMQVVWQWRFTPARDRGRPIKVWGVKHVNFKLRG